MRRLILLFSLGLTQQICAEELQDKSIQTQQNAQLSCVEQRLPECESKCQINSNESAHCYGLCKLNITNECRDAGE